MARHYSWLPPFGRRPRGGLGRGWPLGLYRESPCRAWLDTTPGCLPLAGGQGEGRGGVGFWSFTGKASAEHGSALHLAASLWSQAKGRAGEGVAVGALPGRPLPSMARHYAWLPPFGRRARGGLGRGWLLRLYRESLCRAWLGTTGPSPVYGRGVGVRAAFGALPVGPLPSMARHYGWGFSLRCCGAECVGRNAHALLGSI